MSSLHMSRHEGESLRNRFGGANTSSNQPRWLEQCNKHPSMYLDIYLSIYLCMYMSTGESRIVSVLVPGVRYVYIRTITMGFEI
jgi:hypothetical protein